MASILQYIVTSCGRTFVTAIYALFSVYVPFTLQLVVEPSLWSLGFEFRPVCV